MVKLPLPLINCNATIIFEAMYNIVFLVIISKEFLGVVAIFYLLEITLFFYNAITRASFHESLYWISYIAIVSIYWNALKNKIEEKECQKLRKAVLEELPFADNSWGLKLTNLA